MKIFVFFSNWYKQVNLVNLEKYLLRVYHFSIISNPDTLFNCFSVIVFKNYQLEKQMVLFAIKLEALSVKILNICSPFKLYE